LIAAARGVAGPSLHSLPQKRLRAVAGAVSVDLMLRLAANLVNNNRNNLRANNRARPMRVCD